MAVNDVNEQKLIPGLNMSIVIRDSQEPDLLTASGGSAAISAAGKIITAKVGGVIGDIRSDLTRYEALMTSSVMIPQCSFTSVSTVLSDHIEYPFFFRTIPTLVVLVDAILEMIHGLGWRRILLIFDTTSLGWPARDYFVSRAQSFGIYVLGFQTMSSSDIPMDPTFQTIKDKIGETQSRVQVLLASAETQLMFLKEMKNSGFLSPDYAWITINDISPVLAQEPDPWSYDGLMMVDNGWNLSGYQPFDSFLSEWIQLNATDFPGAGDPTLDDNEGMVYSCVMMIALSYGKLVTDSLPNPADRVLDNPIIQGIRAGDLSAKAKTIDMFDDVPYEGPNGPIMLDANGNRKVGYYTYMSMKNGTSDQFGTNASGKFTKTQEPFFKVGHPNLPEDAPEGAVQNPTWSNTAGIVFGVFCIIGMCLTVLTSILVVYFRDHIIIKAVSPTFCVCELLGILLITIWCMIHVGIPDMGVCVVQTLAYPVGATLLVGSLAIKNYRIYRIFNSVKVLNSGSQTRTVMRYLGVALILVLIPTVIELIVERPGTQKINIQQIQWVRCRDIETNVRWTVVVAIVPLFFIVFGVYFAFKTRNVVYLWNEAKQIAVVLYNVFFLTVIMIISCFFPTELYLATFYISIICPLVIAYLSLFVLFLPKFWKIWRKRNHSWEQESHTGFPTRRQDFELVGDLNGRGGLGGIRGISGTLLLGRLPDDLRAAPIPSKRPRGRSAPQPFTTNTAVDAGSVRHLDLSAVISGPRISFEPNRNLAVNQRAGSLPEEPSLGNRTSSAESSAATLSQATPHSQDGSPMPHKDSIPPVTECRDSDDAGNIITPNQSMSREDRFSREVSGVGGRIAAASASGKDIDAAIFAVHASIEPIHDDFGIYSADTSSSALAETIRMSVNGRSTSYLMLSMTQIECHDGDETNLHIKTSRCGEIIIRFPNQAQLDYWMSLFSPQDLQALKAHSFSETSGTTPQTSVSRPAQTGVEATSSSPSDLGFTSGFNGNGGHSGDGAVRRRSVSTRLASIRPKHHRSINLMLEATESTGTLTAADMSGGDYGGSSRDQSDIFTALERQQQEQQGLRKILSQGISREQHDVESIAMESSIPIYGDVLKNGEAVLNEVWNTNTHNDSADPSNRNGSRDAGYPPKQHPLNRGSLDVTVDDQALQEASRSVETSGYPKAQQHVSTLHTPPWRSSDFSEARPSFDSHHDPLTQPPISSNSGDSMLHRQEPSIVCNGSCAENGQDSTCLHMEDSDSDDLYDPEFGIGAGQGQGRRRRRKPNHPRLAYQNGSGVPQSSYSGTATLGYKAGTIPSAAVISAAAAAVSAGWSESEALAHATVDPSFISPQTGVDSRTREQSRSSFGHRYFDRTITN
ncbi:hypothetical protein BGZ99_001539 [Dissophora globulifera]|uniref:G-protein coupled receptors family 3 profile domain-containing protein n=1 Tax=Dissophora globulifera TaxID=979702 RepID=A0A9P6V0L4_9FUNG|nr:hypothetical protein BGZ99_001539 [Dissophora globulifera]